MDWGWLLAIFLFIVILVLIIIAFFWWLAYKIVFYPEKKHIWKPNVPYEELYLPIRNLGSTASFLAHRNPEQIKNYAIQQDKAHFNQKPTNGHYLHAWHINNFPDRPTVLYFHGNSGNISYREYAANICSAFKLNLFLIDYRGFGNSDSTLSIEGILDDASTAYEYLAQKLNPKTDLIVWGESLGGMLAVYTASKYPCRNLVLLATFSSLDDILTNSPNFSKYVKGPMAWFIRALVAGGYPSKKWITQIDRDTRVVMMHSPNDDLIPFVSSKTLYDAIPLPSSLPSALPSSLPSALPSSLPHHQQEQNHQNQHAHVHVHHRGHHQKGREDKNREDKDREDKNRDRSKGEKLFITIDGGHSTPIISETDILTLLSFCNVLDPSTSEAQHKENAITACKSLRRLLRGEE